MRWKSFAGGEYPHGIQFGWIVQTFSRWCSYTKYIRREGGVCTCVLLQLITNIDERLSNSRVSFLQRYSLSVVCFCFVLHFSPCFEEHTRGEHVCVQCKNDNICCCVAVLIADAASDEIGGDCCACLLHTIAICKHEWVVVCCAAECGHRHHRNH